MQKIMFNDRYGLTDAVLEGCKTMTRRLVPREFFTLTWDYRDDTLVYENDFGDFIDIRQSKYARYQIGEEVAVAQSYEAIARQHPDVDYFFEQVAKAYGVDACEVRQLAGYRNKMFTKAEVMPHRIRITSIRPERLQDISDEDCLREGISEAWYESTDTTKYGFPDMVRGTAVEFDTPREAFAALIDKVSGRGTWVSNLWVVSYEFELIR